MVLAFAGTTLRLAFRQRLASFSTLEGGNLFIRLEEIIGPRLRGDDAAASHPTAC